MSGQSLPLGFLTATHTDSEAEDEGREEESEKSPDDDSSVNSDNSSAATNLHARLVCYHDDTLVSDDGVPAKVTDRRKSSGTEPEVEPPDLLRLFPEPAGRCSNELQEKINQLYEKMQNSGLDMNQVIQQRRFFRNPSTYENLIQFYRINELGTNYPSDAYDPLRWGKESYYEELAKVQKAEMDRHERERKDKTKVEFVSGTAKRPGSGSGNEDDAKRRKSKWDRIGTMRGSTSS